MVEIVPNMVDSAFLYFHTRSSTGDEIAPFVDEIRAGLPTTYIWAGDGGIDGRMDDPVMGGTVSYASGSERYWFVFPMQATTPEMFAAKSEAMGAVLMTCGGYVNTFVDQVKAHFHLSASRVILCGHQHGSCVALAAAMMRREDPFLLTVVFDPWPLETLYYQYEDRFPQGKVVCIDNQWVRERERQRGTEKPVYQVFQSYGINAEGVTLNDGEGKPDVIMFREAIRQVRMALD